MLLSLTGLMVVVGVFVLQYSHAVTIKPLTPGTSWQLQLSGTVNETVLDNVANPKKMYDLDLADNDAALISRLKAKNIVVICYFSAGTSENWRTDYNSFTVAVKGSPVAGWAGENWLDVRNTAVLGPIMSARMDLALSKGCDGVDPDNMDGYANSSGFPLTANDQITYNRFIAAMAHSHGLSVGLKNDVAQLSSLVGNFDWALNEECNQYNECGGYSVFIAQNKAVFGVEYKGSTSTFCPSMNAANNDWLLKDLSLGATRAACREGNGSAGTPIPTAPPNITPAPTPTPVLTPSPVLASTNCTIPVATYGKSTVTYSVPTAGTYRVWNRIQAQDATNNSFFLQVDGGCAVNVGDAAIAPNMLTWVDYQDGVATSKINMTLTAGSHTFVLTGREPGVMVDRVMFSSVSSCVPTGTGDNCANASTPSPSATPTLTPIPTPTPTAIVTPTPTPIAITADFNADRKVNIFDLSILLSHWGQSGVGDIDKSGTVNIFDLSRLLVAWTG